jgi:ATP-dependent Clp protease ATP-binding subunit ClpB
MNQNNLTVKAQQVLQDALQRAIASSSASIDAEHIFLALCADPQSAAVGILNKIGVPLQSVVQRVELDIQNTPKVQGSTPSQLSPSAQQMMIDSFAIAQQLADEYVSTEHMLVAIASMGKGV